MTKKNIKKIAVDPDFAKSLKKLAAEEDMSMIKLTGKLSDKMKRKGRKDLDAFDF